MAEEFALQQRLGESRATHRHEGLRRPVARIVDGPCHQFLSGAALALDEDRAAQAGDLAAERHDLLHPRILTHDIVHAVLPRQFLAQDGVLALQVLDLDDAVDQKRDFLRVAGLDDVLLRALLHGGDGGIHRRVGRDDDDRSFRVQPPDLHHGLDAVHPAGHLQIDKVDGIVAQPRLLHRIAAGGRRVHDVSVFAEPGGQRFAHHLFVVHHQNLPVSLHSYAPLGMLRPSACAQAAQNASSFKSICRTVVASDIAHFRSAQCTSPNRWPVS